jgi:hypothetical protein
MLAELCERLAAALFAAASFVHWGSFPNREPACETTPELRSQNVQGATGDQTVRMIGKVP